MSPDLEAALEVINDHFGEVRISWRHRWRPVAFGVCRRCYWPAHTLGPDGQPWHAFCWQNATPPSGYDQYILRVDGPSEWANRPAAPARVDGERQWCGVAGRWFTPTPERLAICDGHAAEMAARWRR